MSFRWTVWLGPRIKLYRTKSLGWMGDQVSLRWDTYCVHANVGTFHFLYLRRPL